MCAQRRYAQLPHEVTRSPTRHIQMSCARTVATHAGRHQSTHCALSFTTYAQVDAADETATRVSRVCPAPTYTHKQAASEAMARSLSATADSGGDVSPSSSSGGSGGAANPGGAVHIPDGYTVISRPLEQMYKDFASVLSQSIASDSSWEQARTQSERTPVEKGERLCARVCST